MSKYLCNTATHLRAFALALIVFSIISVGHVAKAAETGSKGIRVIVDGTSTYYQTTDKTVGEFLANENIEVSEEDIINVDMDAEITSSMRIVIDKPFEVEVSVDNGEYETVTTNVETIGKLIVQLRENNEDVDYQTAEGVSSSTKLEAGAKINLVSVTSKTFTKTETIPFETKTVDTDAYYVGETNIAQEGVDGEKVITMKSVYVGGTLKETYSIDSNVTKTPVDKIIENGTKEKPVETPKTTQTTQSTQSAPFSYSSVVTMSATAYCPCSKCCGSGAKGITANGMKAQYGVVAVDKKVIPLGTKLYIEGYGYAIAADTGSAIKGNRIDLCYNTHYSALHSGYGHTPVKVYILN
jgi:3D (Asp-Asp-Asp) domain-containing protein